MFFQRLIAALQHGIGVARDAMTARVPLKLWNQPHWELHGHVDSARFFESLPLLGEATTLYLEGTVVAEDVEAFFRSHTEAGPYLPDTQTLWTTGVTKQFRLPASPVVLEGLARMTRSHAEPELFEHLFLYRDSEAIVEYPDAFYDDSPIFVSRHVAEERVRAFADGLGLRVSREGL